MKKCEITDKCRQSPEEIKKLKEILSSIPDEKELNNKSEMFKALSDTTRLKIMYILKNGELCVCEIMVALEKPQSTISHHLNVLKNAGLIKWRKEGIWMYYKLTYPFIIDIIHDLERNSEL